MVASLQTIMKETPPRMQAIARVIQGFAVQLQADGRPLEQHTGHLIL
jgi:hypothetical protein